MGSVYSAEVAFLRVFNAREFPTNFNLFSAQETAVTVPMLCAEAARQTQRLCSRTKRSIHVFVYINDRFTDRPELWN